MIPEVSPCGYPVDLLRRCYSTDAQFYRDDLRITRIVWYRVPRDRPFLPVPTIYASSIWNHNNEFRQPVGEVGQGELLMADRPYSLGNDPTATRWHKGQFCGTAAQWAGGLYTPPRPRLTMDCCSHGTSCLGSFPVGGPIFMVGPTFAAKSTSIFSRDLGPIGVLPRPPMIEGRPFYPPCTWADHPQAVELDFWIFRVSNPDAKHVTYQLQYTRTPAGFSFVYETTLKRPAWDWYAGDPVVLPLTLVAEPLWELPAAVAIYGSDSLA